MTGLFAKFAQEIERAAEDDFARDLSLGGRLLLAEEGPLTVTYAPFDYIERGARLVIVGITPGAQQARNGLLEARRLLRAGASREDAMAGAKVYASFSGPMRANLVAMLDHIGLHQWLGVDTTARVWSSRSDLVHFTSALRYPVFVARRNYSGAPPMTTTAILRNLLALHLADEASRLADAVWVPLGPKATDGILWLCDQGLLPPERVLAGLPHPSGANNERIAYFLGRTPRSELSIKTEPDRIDRNRERIRAMVARLIDEGTALERSGATTLETTQRR